MEFIVVSGAGVAAREDALRAACETAPRLTAVDGPLQYLAANEVFVAGARPLTDGSKNWFWDGHGVCEGSAFSSGTYWAPKAHMLDQYARASASGGPVSDLRGVFTALQFDTSTGAFDILLDPMSQYSLFMYQRDGLLVASNSIYMLVAIVATFGIRLSRDIEAGCFEVGCSIGGGTRTGYSEVSLLPFGHRITGQDGKHAVLPTKLADVTEGLDYSQLLEKSAERMTDYMSALDRATGSDGLLFDLTGGQDSRICFAAAIGAGIKDLNFFVGGDEGDDDRYVARTIARTYGAKEGNFPENYTENAVSAKEMARRATFRQQGHSTLYHYALGTARLPGVCRVRGGAGEIARSHLSPISRGSLFSAAPFRFLRKFAGNDRLYREALSAYWRGIFNKQQRASARMAYKFCGSLRGQQALFTREYRQYALRSLHRDLSQHAVKPDSIGMDLYLKDRARRHFGYMTRAMNFSLGAFEPLFDPYVLAAAEALDWEERASGKLVFDLIEKMAGRQLLEIPFAAKSLQEKPRAYLAARLDRDPASLSVVDRSPNADIERAKILTAGSIDQWAAFDGPASFGMHARYLWQNRAYLRELTQALPQDHACWNLLQRDGFLRAVNSDSYFYSSGTRATRGLRLLHMFIWLAGEESPTGISELVE